MNDPCKPSKRKTSQSSEPGLTSQLLNMPFKLW